MSASGWAQFWKAEEKAFYDVMEIATAYFASRINKEFGIQAHHKILDYGCGPGFLAHHLSQTKASVTGVDINDLFITEGKRNNPHAEFIHVTTDVAENQNILAEKLGNRQFDFVTLLSVTQYLKDDKELSGIIRLLLPYVREKGKIILADIVDERTSSVKDALALLGHCISKGRVVAFIRFICYLMLSNYSTMSKKFKLFKLHEQSIKSLAAGLQLEIEKVDGLTMHPSRTNYVLSRQSEH